MRSKRERKTKISHEPYLHNNQIAGGGRRGASRVIPWLDTKAADAGVLPPIQTPKNNSEAPGHKHESPCWLAFAIATSEANQHPTSKIQHPARSAPRPLHINPAIHSQHLPRNVSSFLASQKPHRRRDVLRPAQPAQRNRFQHFLFQLVG